MLPTLLVVAGAFCALFLIRLGGAQRKALFRHWPTALLAGAAIWALARGALWTAFVLTLVAVGLAMLTPDVLRRWRNRPTPNAVNREEEAARQLLGVGPEASETDIRAAYRAKMAQAHPDRGGHHADAARLTAARDRLLKRRR